MSGRHARVQTSNIRHQRLHLLRLAVYCTGTRSTQAHGSLRLCHQLTIPTGEPDCILAEVSLHPQPLARPWRPGAIRCQGSFRQLGKFITTSWLSSSPIMCLNCDVLQFRARSAEVVGELENSSSLGKAIFPAKHLPWVVMRWELRPCPGPQSCSHGFS